MQEKKNNILRDKNLKLQTQKDQYVTNKKNTTGKILKLTQHNVIVIKINSYKKGQKKLKNAKKNKQRHQLQ